MALAACGGELPQSDTGGGKSSGGSSGGSSGSSGSRGNIRIENRASKSIFELYVSPVSSGWGPDVLGSGLILSGRTFTIENVPVGRYDIKVVFSNGNSAYLWNGAVQANRTLVVDVR